MRTRFLLGMSLSLFLSTFPATASCQAAAESVLLGAGSSTAGVKAGSALGSALNQSSKQLGARIQQQVPQPRQGKTPQWSQKPRPKGRTGGSATSNSPQPGTMIVSVQGGEPNCAPANEKASTPVGKATAEPARTNCPSQNTSVQPGSQRYSPVVTLSFPK